VDKIKGLLSAIGGLIIIAISTAILLIIYGLIFHGVAKVSTTILPWINRATIISFLLFVIILIPLSLFRKTKAISGIGMRYASYIFGLNAWILGFIYTLSIWGWTAIFIGLVFLGVGVVPIGILALAIKGLWYPCIELIILIIVVFGVRLWGAYLMVRADELSIEDEPEEWEERLSIEDEPEEEEKEWDVELMFGKKLSELDESEMEVLKTIGWEDERDKGG